MKKFFYILIVLSMMTTMFTACENDAPEINFTQTNNHVSDFSGIINAIKDQTRSLEEKLGLIEDAIKNQTLTFSQKFDVLNTAVENGVLKLNDMVAKMTEIVTSLDKIADQVTAVEAAIKTLNESVKAGNLSLAELVTKAQGIIDAIGANTDAVNNNGQIIKAQIEALNMLFTTKLGDIVNGIGELTSSNESILEAFNKMKDDHGIYFDAQDNKSLYADPKVWATLSADKELSKMYAAKLSITDNGTKNRHQTAAFGNHGIYDYERNLFCTNLVTGVPNNPEITKEVCKCVAKVTKRIFKAWNDPSSNFSKAYVTDVYGTREERTLTKTLNGDGTQCEYTCILTLWDREKGIWVTEYSVYGSQDEQDPASVSAR